MQLLVRRKWTTKTATGGCTAKINKSAGGTAVAVLTNHTAIHFLPQVACALQSRWRLGRASVSLLSRVRSCNSALLQQCALFVGALHSRKRSTFFYAHARGKISHFEVWKIVQSNSVYFFYRAKIDRPQKCLMRKILKRKGKIWCKKWRRKTAKLCNTSGRFSCAWSQTQKSTTQKSSKFNHLTEKMWVAAGFLTNNRLLEAPPCKPSQLFVYKQLLKEESAWRKM